MSYIRSIVRSCDIMVQLEEKLKSKDDVLIELRRLDRMLGELKGMVEEIRNDSQLTYEYSSLLNRLENAISWIRVIKNKLFRILGEMVYKNE